MTEKNKSNNNVKKMYHTKTNKKKVGITKIILK